MPEGLPLVLLLAGAPALAALAGGWVALHHRPSTLASSLIFGFAGGAMMGTVALEMVPHGLASAGLWPSVATFVLGFGLIYAFDLWMHGGMVAGEQAQQRRRVRVYQRRRQARQGDALVLAGATSLEELVEGAAIGVAVVVDPGLAIVIGLAVLINNAAEAMAIGEMFRNEAARGGRPVRRQTMVWTGTIALALVGSAVLAWLLLRDIPPEALGMLIAAGAGGLLYLTLADLLPEGEQRHFQHSGALAAALGFTLILVVATVAGAG